MKENPLGTLLVAVLVLMVAATTGLAYTYIQSARDLQRLQYQTSLINGRRGPFQAFASELSDYSRRNPAIDPILQSIGIKGTNQMRNPTANRNLRTP